MHEGDVVRLTNGRGSIGHGRIDRLTKNALIVEVGEVRSVERPPVLRLLLPVADRDRMLWLAEKTTELALSTWQPGLFQRSASVAPRGESEAFTKKTRARMIAALEQSRGAWLPELMPALPLAEALVRSGTSGGERFVLERGGTPLVQMRPMSADVIVGPEGGIESSERSLIVDRYGWLPSSLGDTTLRFETAGTVAIGMLRALLAPPPVS